MDFRKYIFKIGIKAKLLVALIILIIASYFLYSSLLAPLFAQQKKLRLNLLSQKKLLETRLDSVVGISNLETELNKAKMELEDIENNFLTEGELPVFFARLRNLAGVSYVDILNLKVGEKHPLSIDFGTKDFTSYEELPVNISLTGDYLATILFLAQLRKEPAIFSISKMSMSAQGKSEPIRTDLQLTLYLIEDIEQQNEK